MMTELPSFRYQEREYRRLYQQAYRRGLRRPVIKVPLEVRLLGMTDRENGPVVSPELGRCWTFFGAPNAAGYGIIADNDGKLQLAHRMSLSIALGRPLAEDMWALHRCDNRRCIRPKHLYEGTPEQNVQDMVDRGRASWQVPMQG